jgi:hypothetical protein
MFVLDIAFTSFIKKHFNGSNSNTYNSSSHSTGTGRKGLENLDLSRTYYTMEYCYTRMAYTKSGK